MKGRLASFVSFTATLALVTGLVTGVGLMSTTQDAEAATAQSCGTITCYVSDAKQGESVWSKANDGGKKASGGGTVSNYSYTFDVCKWWFGTAGKTYTSYPDPREGGARCYVKGGSYGGGSGNAGIQCDAKNGRSPYGITNVFFNDNGNKRFLYAHCSYPSDASYNPVVTGNGKIYTGGQSWFYITHSDANSAQRYNGGGQLLTQSKYVNRGADLSHPEAWIGTWGVGFKAETQAINNQPVYGYYRMDTKLNYVDCAKYSYPAWMGIAPYYACGGTKTEYQTTPYTYSCSFSPALRTGIVGGASFNATDCATSRGWVACTLTGSFIINKWNGATSVMRNNEPVSAVGGDLTYTADSVNVTDIKKKMTITVDNKSVSPSNPDGKVNSTKAYYFLWKQDGETRQDFNTAIDYSKNFTLSWLWSSDSYKSWQATQTGSLTAKALLPTSNGMEFVTITPTCSGALPSNKVVAVRAVGNG